jgi:hypothetical protein
MNGPQFLKDGLIGLPCTAVSKTEYLWQFRFGLDQSVLNLECPWRILRDGEVAFGCDDHDQQFGQNYKIDGPKKTKELLAESRVTLVEVRDGPGDLLVAFENDLQLEAFNLSSGYEGWTCSFKSGALVVAQGGGNISTWSPT